MMAPTHCPVCSVELTTNEEPFSIMGWCPQTIYPAEYGKYPGPEYSYWLEKFTDPNTPPNISEQYCFNQHYNKMGYVLSALIHYQIKQTQIGFYLMSQDVIGAFDDEDVLTKINSLDYLPKDYKEMLSKLKLLITFQ